ncbi:MAG: hypothetical protein WHU10_02180 [Fimbriimonadales bacterium]
MLYGWPGSGKTTVLNRAVETLGHGRVLYLTWSDQLSRFVRRRLGVFLPDSSAVEVACMPFVRFVAELCGEDVPTLGMEESYARFLEALGHQQLPKNWKNLDDALLAEIRARLIGAAIPGESDSVRANGIWHVSDDAYRRNRCGKDRLSDASAQQVLEVFDRLQEKGAWKRIFPELAAAFRATEAVRSGRLPDSLKSFDQIVVDEVQDLTRVEINLVAEHAKAIAKNGEPPFVLLAGDPGQTVRPTGFDPGVLGERFGLHLGGLPRQELGGSLRCPPNINLAIAEIGRFWSKLTKAFRPSAASAYLPHNGAVEDHAEPGGGADGRVYRISIPVVEEARDFLQDLSQLTRTRVIVAASRVPDWLPADLRDRVLTPAEAKGLEYEAVVVLDPGKALARFQRYSREDWRVNEEQSRLLIDQLRVAISRASDCLAFVDVAATEEELALSRTVLPVSTAIEPEAFLLEREEMDTLGEERLVSVLQEVEGLLETRPSRAWRNLHWALLQVEEEPIEAGEAGIGHRVLRTVLSVGMWLFANGLPRDLREEDVAEPVLRAAARWRGDAVTEAASAFLDWLKDTEKPPYPVIEKLAGLGSDLEPFQRAVDARRQTLIRAVEEGCRKPELAKWYTDAVDQWLAFCGRPNFVQEVNRLRRQAVRTLIAHGDLESAEAVYQKIWPRDRRLSAELEEAKGQFAWAAETFEQLGIIDDARRCWRRALNWERALELASGPEAEEIRWLLRLRQTLAARPQELSERLTKEERELLRSMARELQGGGGRPSGGA